MKRRWSFDDGIFVAMCKWALRRFTASLVYRVCLVGWLFYQENPTVPRRIFLGEGKKKKVAELIFPPNSREEALENLLKAMENLSSREIKYCRIWWNQRESNIQNPKWLIKKGFNRWFAKWQSFLNPCWLWPKAVRWLYNHNFQGVKIQSNSTLYIYGCFRFMNVLTGDASLLWPIYIARNPRGFGTFCT